MTQKSNIYTFILLCLLLAMSYDSYGQWKIYQDKMTDSREIYSIHNESGIAVRPIFFPEVYSSDSTNLVGFEMINKENATWSRLFADHLSVAINRDCLFMKFYSENIRRVHVGLADSLGSKYIGKLVIENEYYHTPIMTQLGLWTLENDQSTLSAYPHDTLKISELFIKIEKINNNNPAKLILTDFSIFTPFFSPIEVNHPFFDKLTKQTSFTSLPYNSFSSPSGMPYVLNTFDQYCLLPLDGGRFDIEFDDRLTKKEAIREFCSLLIERYPFYKERNIDQVQITKLMDSVFSIDSIELRTDHLELLIREFKDPHFYLINPYKKEAKQEAKLKPGPISLHMFYHDIYVAGIYDSIIATRLPIGSKVLEVDDIDVNRLLDSVSGKYSGHYNNRRSKALARLLYRAANDETQLKVLHHKDTIEVTLRYDKANKIPANFKPINREYKILTDDVAYFRLNTWSQGDWLSLYNHAEDLKKRKGLIIDLRNNGGGFGSEGIRIASCFIDKPTIYSHSIFNWDEESSIKETAVIKPNGYLDLSHLKVVILGNERTACASEIFIDFMRRNANSLLISTCNTAGAYAYLYFANIGGLTFGFNSMLKPLMGDKKCIENEGIEPDIYVTISNVLDLYPYNDKLLKTGMYVLGN